VAISPKSLVTAALAVVSVSDRAAVPETPRGARTNCWALSGNLYFAGEHCHASETGYMNSGVASGRATARALLARLDGH
jgi:flavin-dependent amine oxidoreductase